MIKLKCAKCGSELMITGMSGDIDIPELSILPCRGCSEDAKRVSKAITTILQYAERGRHE